MLSNFFINRPIFSWVIALLLMGAGGLAAFHLPVQQYPTVVPPEVTITATYPGASAETLDKTVTQIIEQNMTGLDHLRYFSSQSSSSGVAQITLTFDTGADPDIAQVQTQNKLSQAIPTLPSQVQQLGIKVEKSNPSNALVVAFYSKTGKINQDDISDYIASNIVEPVGRVEGVGQIMAFSPQHSLRVWLNPEKLFSYKMTTLEVMDAIRNQNQQLSSGQLGGTPSAPHQEINAAITSQTLLSSPDEFKAIVLRTLPDGSTVTLADVARVEIGAENYDSIRRFNGRPAAGFGVSLESDANALETIAAVKERINAFKASFPADVAVAYPIDVGPFIELSVKDVVKSLFLSMLLVLIIMYVFLQDWRATLIPGLAIPTVLLGTLACLSVFGYSINILTLFAMVLSIGLLVDDAIVVTENVKRTMEENPGISPREAARKSMAQLWGALMGVTAVLCAVFVPMAFFQGASGVIYRQFSATILSSMILSLGIALTLSPAVAGSILKHQEEGKKSFIFFRWFNRGYEKAAAFYDKSVKWILGHAKTGLGIFAILVTITVLVFFQIPGAFLPDEDQGRLFTLIEGPPNATFERMLEPVKEVERFFLKDVGGAVDGIFTVIGFSFSGRGQNTATGFVNLKEAQKREGKATSSFALSQQGMKKFSTNREVKVAIISPPPISQLGNATGFEFQLVDRGRLGREALIAARDEMLKLTNQNPLIKYTRLNALEEVPQFSIDLDFKKAQALGVSVEAVNDTLSTAWAGRYVNNYIEGNRVKRVFLQGEAAYRMDPEDLGKWFVLNSHEKMVSLADLSKGSWSFGPPQAQRFNGFPSFEFQGEAAPGASTGEAMEEIQKLAGKLPEGIGIEWTGLSFEERQAGSQVNALYSISVIVIFLALAALYESWSIPLSIMLVLPLGILGAALLVWLTGLSDDVYFKVGFLLTMGLAAKNAILIVEFANQRIESGEEVLKATIEACERRFRPILMTSLTFFLGVIPLVLARGPGSGAQNAIGMSLLGGITSTTLLIIFFAPLFYVGILRLTKKKEGGAA